MMKALIEEAEFLANMEKKVQLARARGAQDGHLSVRLREGPTMGEFTVEARYGGGEAYITIRGEDLSSHSDRGRSAKIAAVALAYRLNARSITPRLLTSIRKLFEQRAVEAGLAPPPPDYFEARRRPSDKYAAPKPERVKIKRDDPTPRSPKQRGGR